MDLGIVETAPLVLREDRGPVAWLRLNRPADGNLLSTGMLEALSAALAAAEADRDIRVVVLAAVGKLFSAGHDLGEIRADADRARHEALFARCSALMLAIEHGRLPVIACVQGTAVAGGCQVVAACDLAYAATTARFGMTGINLGLFCSTPAVPLSRAVGPKAAMELLLTGRLIEAAEAARIGLINAALAPEALEAHVASVAEEIAGKPPEVVRLGRALFHRQRALDTAAAYAEAGEVMADNLALPAAQEGIDEYLRRRR